MEPIKKRYIFDENQQKVAVQIDLKTFEKIEEALEDFSLAQLIRNNEKDKLLDIIDAESHYSHLEKAE